MTNTTEGRPIDYLRGIADSARSAVYLAKEHRASEAGKHINAIERLIEGYRSVVAAETAELCARVDELAAAAGGATEPDMDGAGRTYEEYYPAPAPRDLRPGAEAARRMLRPGACDACGDIPDEWCPTCAACRQGCYSGHDGNTCTHPNAPWRKAATP